MKMWIEMGMFMYIDIRTTRNTVYNHVGNILREVAKIPLSLFDSKYLGIKKNTFLLVR